MRRLRSNIVNAISLLEVVLSAIISVIFEKIIGFAWEKMKKIHLKRKKESLMLRVADEYFRILALLFDVYPVEIKFRLNYILTQYGFFKGPFRFLGQIFNLSLRDLHPL